MAFDVSPALEVPPAVAGRWLPVLSALFKAEVAAAPAGAELRIKAERAADAVAWGVGSARLQLPCARPHADLGPGAEAVQGATRTPLDDE
ncbi:MAG TPA: hypothetical protein VGI39_27660 [Polyangiaceae bacterium]